MFVADLHNDLVQRVIEGEDVTKLTSHGHTDIPRLLKSEICLLYTSPSPRDEKVSRMPSSA